MQEPLLWRDSLADKSDNCDSPALSLPSYCLSVLSSDSLSLLFEVVDVYLL